MERRIYLTINADNFNPKEFNNGLPEDSKGEIRGKKERINGNICLVNPYWKSKDIYIKDEDVVAADRMTLESLLYFLEKFNPFIQNIKSKKNLDVCLEIVSFYKIRFYESCKDPCNDELLELEECRAAGRHVCGKPFAREGLSLNEETIRLMADVGVRLELNQYWD